MASIKDVAQKAGVGVGTVSRVLNNSGYVSDETREKIEEAMKNLQYTPNELARNLYRKKSGIIAVLVPTVEIPFFAELVHNIEAELYNEGFKIMLGNTDKAHNAELEYLDMLNRHIVDGVITGVHSLDVEEYKKIKKPIVAFDRYLGEDIPVVTVDHKEGGRLAAEILLKNGCKKIVHFRGSTAVESPYHERHFEFARIMKEQGVECFDYELAWNKFDLEYYKYAVKDLFDRLDEWEFDGIFGTDLVAIECMNEVIRRHKKVPKDVKCVAYDGTYITQIVEPSVTSIVQPIKELAKEAARLICELVNTIICYDSLISAGRGWQPFSGFFFYQVTEIVGGQEHFVRKVFYGRQSVCLQFVTLEIVIEQCFEFYQYTFVAFRTGDELPFIEPHTVIQQ